MRHETELLEEQRLYQLVFEQSPDGLVIVDGAGRVIHANGAARDPHGLALRLLSGELKEEGDLSEFAASLRATGHATAEKRVRDGGGEWRHFSLKGTRVAPDRFAILTRDVTERRDMEAELGQLRRVESLGFLTASMIHDFNNLLTPIVCLSAVLTREIDKGSRAGEMAGEIRETAERAAELVRQMLSFVRRAPERVRRLSVGTVVTEMRGLLRRVVGDEIEIVFAIDDDTGDVNANREQLEQVLLNLAANARDAMPGGGRLFVSTTPVTLVGDGGSAESAARSTLDELEPELAGAYVAIRVSDTGVGMSAEVRARAFERFFTTKPPGKGSGLGLAAAHRFAKATGGSIGVRSTEGIGTTVTVCLPRLDRLQEKAPPSSHETLPRGSETVLVVEDDSAVRGVVRALLEEQGYRVLDAASGSAAIDLASREEDPIDLLLTDVVMPQMGGRALADTLARARPKLKVLFMSGHADSLIQERGVNAGSSALLRKAFSPADLLVKVREALGAVQC